jgi:hypothetical protein
VYGSEFSFYSGMSNIDFELQEGNPAAIAVRFHVAQHNMLTYMDFNVDTARAAVEDIGNQVTNVHIHGGDYEHHHPTHRTGLAVPAYGFRARWTARSGDPDDGCRFMLVRVHFANMPVAMKINRGEVDQLYARDLRLENITDALVVGDWRNLHSEITLANISCSDVPRFTAGDNRVDAPGRHYVADHFSRGLAIGADGREQGVKIAHRERAVSAPGPLADSSTMPFFWKNAIACLGVTVISKRDLTLFFSSKNLPPIRFTARLRVPFLRPTL